MNERHTIRTRAARRSATLALLLGLGALPAMVPMRAARAQAATQPATVRGVVRASATQPLPRAEVMLNDSLVARTDTAGRFTLTGLAAGDVELTVRRIGFLPLSIPLALTAGQRRNLAIELAPLPYRLDPVVVNTSRPGLYGQVVDDAGRPLAGAEVLVLGGADPVLTAEDGGFAVTGLQSRTYLVLVRHEGHYGSRFSLTLPPDHGQEVHVELETLPASLTGGARRLASGRGTMELLRLRDFDRRVRINRPLLVPRDVLAKGGKRDISDVLMRDRLTPVPTPETVGHIPEVAWSSSDAGTNTHLAAPDLATSTAEDAITRMRLATGAKGACYFIDGEFAHDQQMANTTPASWIETVEVTRHDDSNTLERRLPPGVQCGLYIVLWMRR